MLFDVQFFISLFPHSGEKRSHFWICEGEPKEGELEEAKQNGPIKR